MRKPYASLLLAALAALPLAAQTAVQISVPAKVFGYADFTAEAGIEARFLAAPNAAQAGEYLKLLTTAPHMAATPEDRKTAEYVAQEFRAAGLETEIVPYRVLMNQPKVVRVEAWDRSGRTLMTGPTPEHVAGDPGDNDPRVVMPFNGSSGSGDVTGEVVYANYGRLEDFNVLAARHIDLKGKIVICRYGENFRGVKAYLAEQRGAAGVLIYSDPQDDGYFKGDPYPNGPWRPDTAVQRGSVQYLFKYAGDPETPGVASTPELPDSERVSPYGDQPHIISIPLSYHDAAPILASLKGADVPDGWQGALPFRYHMGGVGAVTADLVSEQDYERRIIWDVIGRVEGSQSPNEWVMAGNHRDAWVYGAVDPSSGTAAMLEAVRGIGVLLKQGWRPKRTIVMCSWDAEEEGLIGSTEWVEQHMQTLGQAVAYFNMDVGVAGPDFSAAAVPSLKEFILELTQSVPSPQGGTVYQAWKRSRAGEIRGSDTEPTIWTSTVKVGALGSGSDYTPFLQHAGVPSTDIGSGGPYGVYHSTFDDFAWYTENADPKFLYLQEMARVFGLEVVRMADADVLPYDYVSYASAIASYIETAKHKAAADGLRGLNFVPAEAAVLRLEAAAAKAHALQEAAAGDLSGLNQALRETESDFLSPAGLPDRPWYRHTIYAPGVYTGYAAVVIPGVNEALDAHEAARAAGQLAMLTDALNRAAQTLEQAR